MEKSEEKQVLVPVIPLVPLPFGRSPVFSYVSAEPIPAGTLVFVPFGPRTVRGVVWDVPSEENIFLQEKKKRIERRGMRKAIRYRPIKTVLPVPRVPEVTRRIAEYIAEWYLTPLGRVLEDILPKAVYSIPKKVDETPKKRKLSWTPLGFGMGSEMKLTTDQLRAAREVLKKKHVPVYLYGPAASGKTWVYHCIIRERLKRSGQALVVVPDRVVVMLEEERYKHVFGAESVAVFHADLSDGALRTLREDVASGKKRIIIGTRQALFLPFRELSVMVLDDEDSALYKQFSVSPRYDARRVMEEFGNITHALTLFGSSAPSASEYLRAKEVHSLVVLPPRMALPRIETVNLRIERWKKRYQPISRDLEDVIREALVRKEQILLVVGRGGMSAFSVCASCKAIFRCPNCHKPYRYEREGFFRCHACGSKTDETPQCPVCHSLEFRHIGVGTERVERDFERRFPGTSLVRWDAGRIDRASTLNQLREFLHGTRSVLITTAAGAVGWNLPRLSLIAMIEADSGFGFSGWNADEEAFRAMVKAVGCIAASGRGLAVLQTFHPENRLFEMLRNGSILPFLDERSEERRTLLYPPFADLIRVRYEATTDRALSKAFSSLEEQLGGIQRDFSKAFRFQIFPPSSDIRRKKRIQSQEALLRVARLQYGGSPELNQAIQSLLYMLLPNWIVDVDPLR